VHAIKEAWERGEAEPDAWAALQRHPELWDDAGAVQDLAYEEYMLREAAGRPPESEAFCERFGPHGPTLRKMIGVHKFLNPLLYRLTDPDWPEPGLQLGDFKLLRELGRGAFARVFLAVEGQAGGRLVVVKLSAGADDEARTLGPLEHPNIVPLLSARVFAQAGLRAVCMPFAGTATLHHLLRLAFPRPGSPAPRRAGVILEAARSADRPGDPAPAPRRPDPLLAHGSFADGVMHLGAQLADALAFAHERGVCHRDLKPSNVLLGPDGRPLLIDFNLSTAPLVRAKRRGGTLPYMAPEQVRAGLDDDELAPIDARADLFALGVLLYELLTGKHPFGPVPEDLDDEDRFAAVLLQRQRAGFVPLRRLNPGVGAAGARAIERCLAPEPADRPASASALAEELRRYFKPAARARRWAVRNAAALACLAVALLLGPCAATWGLAGRDPAGVRESRRAHAALVEGDYARAVKHLSRAIEADPDRASAWFDRGQARLRWSEGQSGEESAATVEEALADFRQARKLAAETAGPAGEALHRRGRAAYQKGDYPLAEQCYTGALEEDGTRPAVWFDRGRSRVKQAEGATGPDAAAKWTGALDDFNRADQLLGGDGATLACVAYCMSRKDSFRGAVVVYDRAIEAGFPAARLLNNRARCLLQSPQRGNPTERDGAARADLDAALRQQPGLRAAYCNRALLAVQQWMGCSQKEPLAGTAIADLERAIELGPPNGALYELAATTAAAMAAHASLKDWDGWKGRALAYLELATAFGQDPNRLAQNLVLKDLISAEEFAALSRIRATAQTAPLDSLLWADPIED
jgi:tetratricopeptide (TPR) repeat protein